MTDDEFLAGAADYVYPAEPEAVAKELAAAAWARCNVEHPRLKSVRCLRAKGHDGQHYCGGPAMGIKWDDPSEVESGNEGAQVVSEPG